MTKVGRLFAEEAEQKAQLADAKRLVGDLSNIISKGYSETEACELVGVSLDDYNNAKNLLNSSVVSA